MSILLAFAIDAWWEEHREVEVKRAQLHSLLDEFNEARGQLESQVRSLENSLRGTIQFLELDVSALLRDPGVNTVFTMRAVRSQILLQSHEDAIQIADEIIALLAGLNQ